VTIHGQTCGQNISKYILGFKVIFVLWGNACNEYHIVIGYVFVVLLVLLDNKFVALIPLP